MATLLKGKNTVVEAVITAVITAGKIWRHQKKGTAYVIPWVLL
jgi:hypothetical protein